MTQPPANWYPDPHQPAQLRYWDGAQWTAHVAPSSGPAAATPPKRMGGGAIAAIVIGSVIVFVFVIGILAAIAIPVFLNQQTKAAQIATDNSAMSAATAIESHFVYYPAEDPIVASSALGATVSSQDGLQVLTADFEDGVTLGGFVSYNSGEWCVWVVGEHTAQSHWSSSSGLGEGACP